MGKLRLFILFSIFISLSNSTAFNIDEINSANYNIDIIGVPILKKEFGDDIHIMTSTRGQEFACTLPVLPPDITGGVKSKDDATAQEGNVDISELLKPMEEAPCILLTKGWWTYEFCYGNVIIQYHLEDGKRSGLELILGKYESEYDWSNRGRVMADVSKSNRLERFHSQYYSNGTKCDLTGEPRKAEVRFKCNSNSGDFIERVDEPESCRYILTVATTRVCHHPYLRPKPTVAPHKITCNPVLDEKRYKEYIDKIAKKAAGEKTKEEMADATNKKLVAEKENQLGGIEIINVATPDEGLQRQFGIVIRSSSNDKKIPAAKHESHATKPEDGQKSSVRKRIQYPVELLDAMAELDDMYSDAIIMDYLEKEFKQGKVEIHTIDGRVLELLTKMYDDVTKTDFRPDEVYIRQWHILAQQLSELRSDAKYYENRPFGANTVETLAWHNRMLQKFLNTRRFVLKTLRKNKKLLEKRIEKQLEEKTDTDVDPEPFNQQAKRSIEMLIKHFMSQEKLKRLTAAATDKAMKLTDAEKLERRSEETNEYYKMPEWAKEQHRLMGVDIDKYQVDDPRAPKNKVKKTTYGERPKALDDAIDKLSNTFFDISISGQIHRDAEYGFEEKLWRFMQEVDDAIRRSRLNPDQIFMEQWNKLTERFADFKTNSELMKKNPSPGRKEDWLHNPWWLSWHNEIVRQFEKMCKEVLDATENNIKLLEGRVLKTFQEMAASDFNPGSPEEQNNRAVYRLIKDYLSPQNMKFEGRADYDDPDIMLTIDIDPRIRRIPSPYTSLPESTKETLRQSGFDVDGPGKLIKMLTYDQLVEEAGAEIAAETETVVVFVTNKKDQFVEKEKHQSLTDSYNFFLDTGDDPDSANMEESASLSSAAESSVENDHRETISNSNRSEEP